MNKADRLEATYYFKHLTIQLASEIARAQQDMKARVTPEQYAELIQGFGKKFVETYVQGKDQGFEKFFDKVCNQVPQHEGLGTAIALTSLLGACKYLGIMVSSESSSA